MKPTVRYDASVNAAYIRLSNEQVYESQEVSEGVVFDYDLDGRIVGMEVLGARELLPTTLLDDAA